MNPTHNTPPATGPLVAGMLLAAADYLDTYGWTRGQLYDEQRTTDATADVYTPPACAVGAIYSVTRWLSSSSSPAASASAGDTIAALRFEAAAVAALACHLAPGLDAAECSADDLVMVIEDWNDTPIRTQRHVTSALRAAAAKVAGEPR